MRFRIPLRPRRTAALLSLAGLAALGGFAGSAARAAEAWRQSSFDAAHTWFNPDETVLAPNNVGRLVEVWSHMLGQFYVGPTAQARGVLFVCSNLHGLSALTAADGVPVWGDAFLDGDDCGSPALRRDTVYVTSSSLQPNVGYLSALEAATGRQVWTANSTGTTSLGFNDPAVAAGRVFVADRRYAVYAYSADTGATLWRAETPWLNNAAAVAADKVVVTTWDACCDAASPRVYAFDASSGEIAWAAPADTSNMEYPALVAGGRAIAVSDSGAVRAFDLATGAPAWLAMLDGYISSPPAATGRTLVVASANQTLTAIDIATGQTKWVRSIAPAAIASNVVIAGGMLFVSINDREGVHRLLTVNAADGRVLPQKRISALSGDHATVSVVDGRVQVATSYGVLHVLGLAGR